MGIEPTSTAWEAVVLPMNYICDMVIITRRAEDFKRNI